MRVQHPKKGFAKLTEKVPVIVIDAFKRVVAEVFSEKYFGQYRYRAFALWVWYEILKKFKKWHSAPKPGYNYP